MIHHNDHIQGTYHGGVEKNERQEKKSQQRIKTEEQETKSDWQKSEKPRKVSSGQKQKTK